MCSLACEYHVDDNCNSYLFDESNDPPCQLGSLSNNITQLDGGIKVLADLSRYEFKIGWRLPKLESIATSCSYLIDIYVAGIGSTNSQATRIDDPSASTDFELPLRTWDDTEKWKRFEFWRGRGGILACFGIIIATNEPSKICYFVPLGGTNWTALPPSLDGHSFGDTLVLDDGRLFVSGGTRGTEC